MNRREGNVRHVVITGAGGFLGAHLAAAAKRSGAETITLIFSPRATHGVDLAGKDAIHELRQRFRVASPEETAVIHAAALVEWNTPEAIIQNSMMAFNVASWVAEQRIGFAILASSVSAELPQTTYGVGKLAAEHIWRALLPNRHATVRFAGIWGWQRSPSLFWNRVLLAAARKEKEPLHICKSTSRRNHIHADDASRLLLALAQERRCGLFHAAGHDALSTKEFVEAVRHLPGASLSLSCSRDESGADGQIYPCSPELFPYIRPFSEALAETWRAKPEWVTK